MSAGPAKPENEGAVDYAEKHDIFRLFQRLLQELVVQKPDNPIDFLIKTLQLPPVPRIVIAGAPASGKGTQCELIVKQFGVVHISTGDLLREHVKQGTPLGKKADEFMKRGDLVPDDLIIGMVKEKLASEECRKKGWLLDGFPRTQAQAHAMVGAGIVPEKFVLLDVPDAVLIERVVGRRTDPVTNTIYHTKFNPPPPGEVAARCVQRSDDTEEKAGNRLAVYYRNLDAIRDSFRYCERVVNGNRSKVWFSAFLLYFANTAQDAVFADIEDFVVERPRGHPPQHPARLVLTGLPHERVTAISRVVANQLDAVYVNAAEVLRGVAAGNDSDAATVRQALAARTLVPDEIVIRAVLDALSKQGAQAQGYVLQVRGCVQ